MTGLQNPSALSSVYINQQEMNLVVTRATVERCEGQHDYASLFVNSATSTIDFRSLPDQRVEFSFGDFGTQTTFQGYVSSVTPNRRFVGGAVNTEQEIVCLGASMVLKGNKPRFFTDVTCTQMIAQIATEAGLGFNDEYHNDNNQWRQLAQTSETDWEMILNLADRLGARIVYERGVIRLINYLDISFRQLASRFYTSKTNITLLDKTDEQAGTVVEYVPTNMSVRDPSYRSPTLSYLSSKRAVMLSPPMQSSTAQPTVGASSQGALLVSRFATDYPANSQQEAEAYQSGYYQPPWNEEGQLRVTGDALMMPGLIIQVMSSGKGLTMSADYDGVWYVRGVTHSLGTHGRFWSTLDIARTAARGSNWYQPQPFWLRDKRGAPVLRSNGAGQWISNWRAA